MNLTLTDDERQALLQGARLYQRELLRNSNDQCFKDNERLEVDMLKQLALTAALVNRMAEG